MLSSSAYCRSVVPGGKWLNKTSLAHLKFVDVVYSGKLADVAGYVVRDDRRKEIFLVFKGTSSFGNAVADMIFVKTKYHPVNGGASVHKGFYESYMLVQQKVLSLMGQEIKKHSDYHVTVTGHSLGGAYATLAALDLYQRDKRFNKKSMSIITFGEPRVGNPEFATYGASTGIEKKRVVFHKDIVPHVPPMMMGYLHFGTEYWVQKNKKDIYLCDSNHELKQCSNSIVPFTSLVDHTR
ncbi:lipase [Absidia repens]|uniref:Lipase n=1 Tax=Absidia repens TaxID=90262 RepID=A0A1X2HY29_9FUNG|nr:lipase [Absidia repens]